jgi:hypothetical protein
MDPLVSLHYYAPVCAIINACILPFTEGLEPFYALHRVGLLVLVSNAGIAFALNVAAVFLISVGSGLILTLAGVLKDIVGYDVAKLTLALNQRVSHCVWIPNHPATGLWILVSGLTTTLMVAFPSLGLSSSRRRVASRLISPRTALRLTGRRPGC